MAFLTHTHVALKWPAPPQKRARRTATSVLAGDFDNRPRVDVLTSLLNGVKPYRPPLSEEQIREKEELKEKRRLQHLQLAEEREAKRKEKAERKERDKMLMKAAAAEKELVDKEDSQGNSAAAAVAKSREERANSFWQALPPKYTIDLMDPTPEPSDDESLFSRASSKRPHTPFDDDSVDTSSSAPLSPRLYPNTSAPRRDTSPPMKRGPGRPPKRRKLEEDEIDANIASGSTVTSELLPGRSILKKKQSAVKKGWKGWVEAEEDELPKDKLIELDAAIILQDRRTRSGKNFDAISEGQDGWV